MITEPIVFVPFDLWYQAFEEQWEQGQHVVIIGQTGSGKTYLAKDLLRVRRYVAVIAIKRADDTLSRFAKDTPRYALIKKWPPRYDKERVVIWLRPESLSDKEQALRVYQVLDDIYHNGGWCVFLDDTGYVTSVLRLERPVTILLNQARSSGISVVCALTQPSSVVARVPTETLRQARYLIVFRYHNERDIKAIAQIAGYDWRAVREWMGLLGPHDFLAFTPSGVAIVRR